MKRLLFAGFCLAASVAAQSQNPYLPLWEHIPDGEPYVFDDPDRPGHQRVYVYGSHDDLRTEYCGLDQVVWSAPVEDLTQWRYDGVIFQSQYSRDGYLLNRDGRADLLYAPDVVERVEQGRKVYYLCPNVQNGGRQTMVARATRPDGPFRVCNWDTDRTTKGTFQFDPAIFLDDDGRVYGYWGFERSFGAELDPTTMSSVKPGTQVVSDMISSKNQPGDFRFFEASSMRKIGGKYVFIYSRWTKPGEFGLPDTNYTLAYAYSNNPLGPWTYGGTIIDGRARDVDEQGKVIHTAHCGGNTHGSLCQINGRWWVFYHRQTGLNEYSRQAMVAPVDVKVEGDKVIISEGEVTSEGFQTDGLNPLERHAAGIACYYTGREPMQHGWPNYTTGSSYIAATYVGDQGMSGSYSLNTHHSPVVNNTDGSVVGYKYLNMDVLRKLPQVSLCLSLRPLGVKGEIEVMMDSPYESRGGKVVGRLLLDGSQAGQDVELSTPLTGVKGMKGKHAMYLRFKSDTKQKSLCQLYDFIFRINNKVSHV